MKILYNLHCGFGVTPVLTIVYKDIICVFPILSLFYYEVQAVAYVFISDNEEFLLLLLAFESRAHVECL